MSLRSKLNLQEEEALSTEVQRLPCLYDKSNAGCKEKDQKQNAWKEAEHAPQGKVHKTCYQRFTFSYSSLAGSSSSQNLEINDKSSLTRLRFIL